MTIHAVYRGGVLVPQGPLDLREGEEVQLEAHRPEPTGDERLLRTLALAAREMNPSWIWDRDRVYDDE